MDLNKVTLIGNMVRDPESRSLRTGAHVTRFSIATNYAWQDQETKTKKEAVDFHDCIAWGRLGDIVQQYVEKGAKVYIEGRLRKRTFIAKDGAKRSATEVVAENIILLGHRKPTQKRVAPAEDQLIREDVDVDDVED